MDTNISEIYHYSDKIVDEKNGLYLTTECQIKEDCLEFSFTVSNLLRMSHLTAYIHTHT